MGMGYVVAEVLIVGALLGAVILGSVAVVYLRHHTLGRGGSLMIFGGIILFGLSAWQSFEVTAGQVTLKAKSALENVQLAIAVNNASIKSSSSDKCEQELLVTRQKRKKLDEQLRFLEKSLGDLAMAPIRIMR